MMPPMPPPTTAAETDAEIKGATLLPDPLDLDVVITALRPLLNRNIFSKLGHNLKYDDHIFSRGRNGAVRLRTLDDTMCLSFVLDAGTGMGMVWMI